MVQITDESPPSFLTHSVASPTYLHESLIMKLKAFGTRDWQSKEVEGAGVLFAKISLGRHRQS